MARRRQNKASECERIHLYALKRSGTIKPGDTAIMLRSQAMRLVWLSCKRPHVYCGCGRRARVLYRPLAEEHFSCWRCAHVVQPSWQHPSLTNRSINKVTRTIMLRGVYR